MFGFYLSSQHAEKTTAPTSNNASPQYHTDDSDTALKQKLIKDFEIAFLKQYTPLLGCEDMLGKPKNQECIEYHKHAKQEFKQQFIKNRGLPKNTFEDLKLSINE
jgi:hypothetical protein